MKVYPQLPLESVFWYTAPSLPPLKTDRTADVVIVGGGMAGLTAAQAFQVRGLTVILIEKAYCGSGASGKSSGFITSDSELPLEYLIKKHGAPQAKAIWGLAEQGVAHIRDTIHTQGLSCDYQEQDTMVVATTPKAYTNDIVADYTTRQSLGYAGTLLPKDELEQQLGSSLYNGGVAYGGTFGIRAYHYCRELRDRLMDAGVEIYEETPMTALENERVTTPSGSITAKHIVLCTDYEMPSLASLQDNLYHVQTFLMMSAPLSDAEVSAVFPQKRYMVWDTESVYNYFRITGDNRLMVGGSSLQYTYAQEPVYHNERVMRHLSSYVARHFPSLKPQWEYMWPGLIGITKDLFPIAGRSPELPSVYYIAATSGLPWAAGLGIYSAQHLIDGRNDLDAYFSPERTFAISGWKQKLLGTKLSFALSNFWTASSL